MEDQPTHHFDPPSALATASRTRKSLLRDPVRLERAIGIVLWAAFFAVLFHFGR